MALDLKTGRIVWSRQTTPNDVYNSACGGRGPNCPAGSGPDFDFGSSALLVKTAGGRDVLVAGQKSGVVYGLDPVDGGRILWQTRVGAGGTNGGVQWGMASDGQRVYAAVSDVGRQAGSIGGAAGMGNAPLSPTQGGGLTVRPTAPRLQSGPAGGRDRDSRSRVLGRDGRAPARVLGGGRETPVGRGHRQAVHDCERRTRNGRFTRWRRSGRGRQHAVRELGLPALRRHARQRAAGVWTDT
jgi:hypothetical protein